MSVQFFILSSQGRRICTATDSHKAAQILRLMFHNCKGYVVENNKVTFTQNMTIDEAEIAHGLKVAAPIQSMEVLPKTNGTVKAPKAAAVKPKKANKPVKAKAKKTTLKSKVVIKNNKKPTVKKAVVKPKVKPKKPKAKMPKVKNKKPAPKAKGKAKKR